MRVAGVLVFASMLGLLLAGCGSVGDVGYGASRAGVEPVRGTYGSGSSPYAANQTTQERTQRVETLARANEKSEKKTATLLNKTKAEPDATGPAVADVEVPTQPTLDPQVKALIARQETSLPASADLMASENPDR
jgi:hypothetical protein